MVFDWDGTAVPDRDHDASEVRALVEELCGRGMHVAIVSGTHVDDVDGQLGARPTGPGALILALNRGSEIYAVDRDGPRLVERRSASATEDRALDAAAARTVEVLGQRGLPTRLTSEHLNRRTIDLMSEPGRLDQPRPEIGGLVARAPALGLDRGSS